MTLMLVTPLIVRPQRQRLADDVVDVHHHARGLALAREGEQVADDAGGALRLAQDRFEAAAHRIVERRLLRQPLGPAQDRGERVVQFVRHAGDRLAERRHLFRLQELVIDVARLVVQLLAFADVAHQGLDAKARAVGRAVGPGRQFHPDRRVVRAPQPEQIVADRAVGGEALHERGARRRIDEALAVERTHLGIGRFARVAEDQLEVGIGRNRGRRVGGNRPDVDALENGVEEPCECGGATFHVPNYTDAGSAD